MPRVLSLDVAVHTGWALGHWWPTERIVTYDVAGMQASTKTHVYVDECNVLRFPDLEQDNTCLALAQAKRMGKVYAMMQVLLFKLKPDIIVMEAAVQTAWLRGKFRSGQSIATSGAIRGAVLAAIGEMDGIQGVYEIDPAKWQPDILGKGKRAEQKAKSIEAARCRSGVITKSNDLADAVNILDYALNRLALGLPLEGLT